MPVYKKYTRTLESLIKRQLFMNNPNDLYKYGPHGTPKRNEEKEDIPQMYKIFLHSVESSPISVFPYDPHNF